MNLRVVFGTTALVAFGLSMGVGCSQSRRHEVADQGLSVERLDGWQRSTQRGVAVFKDPESRATIAIRSVPFESREAGPREVDGVISATQAVLERLPGARLGHSHPAKSELFRAHTFDLSYRPPGKTQRYQRRHTVVIGKVRIYHLWLTAPAGELAARTKRFEDVVASLREEG